MSELNIVVLDGKYANPGDLSYEALEEFGQLTLHPDTDHQDKPLIQKRIKDAQVVITNKVPLDKETLESTEELDYVIVAATGYNIINLEAAENQGIKVSNIPSYSTQSVVQHTLALLLQLTNQVSHYSQAVQEGRWEESEWTLYDQSEPLTELAGKTLGIIGFGAIGQAFGQLARQLGMDVLAYNRSQNAKGREIANYVDLDHLLKNSDIISLHIPLAPDTEHIINEETISQMKDRVILLNASRGPLVDEEALAQALQAGKVQAAGLDVLAEEPMTENNPLKDAPNAIITPHIAWATKESRGRLLEIIYDNLAAYVKGEPINLVSEHENE